MNVRDFYNKKKEYGKDYREKRKQSPIYNIKIVNNFIKGTLINKFAYNKSILDLACGKGGDLDKFRASRISSYVGIDISEESLKQLLVRYNQKQPPFSAKVYHGDMKNDLPKVANAGLVSCQFAIHYAFETEETANNAIHNVSKNLENGGFFICTTADDEYLTGDINEKHIQVKFYKDEGFAKKYNFTLEDAIIDVDEFLVEKSKLVEICKKYDLELIYDENFENYFDYCYKESPLKSIYRVGKLNSDERAAVKFYRMYVFKKLGIEKNKSKNKQSKYEYNMEVNTF